jgi:transcriptional/translational regulatory protein YebC/TACO1
LKNVGIFLKNVGRSPKNIDYKNVGPKNVAIFCKMLTKNNNNVAEKMLKHFKFNSNEVGS